MPQTMRLSVLHRDAHVVVVDKPPGLLVHRTRIADGDRFVLQALRDQPIAFSVSASACAGSCCMPGGSRSRTR